METVGAVGMLAGHEIRRRGQSTIAIVLLIGVVGAIVLATAAGARRSDTALGRFNATARSSALEISVGTPTAAQLAKFRRTPGIVGMAHLRGFAFSEGGPVPALAIAAPVGAEMGTVVDRSRLISGRRADPAAPNELVVGESLAGRLHLHVGDRFSKKTYTQAQITTAFANGNPGDPAGPDVAFRIVGIDRRPLDLGVRATSGGVVVLTPAFVPKYQGRIGAYTDVLRVRTTDAPGAAARVGTVARQIFGHAPVFGSEGLGKETEGARSAIDVLTLALWIVAGVTALAGFVAIGIVLSRDIASANLDQATLRSLGLTRRERIAANGPRALLVAGGGTLLAGIGAVMLSPLFPIGVARRAEPDPGFHVDWVVVLLGLSMVGIVVLGIALLAAVRATRTIANERAPRAYRATSALVDRAAGAGLRPVATNGLRMAIQSGRGASAVPVRSAFGGAVFGVVGITIALVFAASLSHLIETPRLYGWTWDVKAEVPTANPCVDANDFGLGKASGVDAVGVVCTTFNDFELDGRPLTGWGFRSLHGTIEPEIVVGRAPSGPREMALGSVTMNAIGKHIGDTVTARGPKGAVRYVVVGQGVFPTIGDAQPLADGAAVTEAGYRPLYEPGGNETDYLVARAAPGGRADLERRMRSIRPATNVDTPSIPVEVQRLQQIDRVPASIAALLAALALIAVGHALVTAVRRRRSELALLKVLGFDRRQVRATVAWQATILGGVGLVLGIPVGIILGRLLWQAVANGLGVSPEVTAPALWLLLCVPCVLVLVNLIALFPARSAARTRPAVALRSA